MAAIEAAFAEKENKGNEENFEKASNQNSGIPTIETLEIESLQKNTAKEEVQTNNFIQSQSSTLSGTKLRRKISIVED